MISLACMDPYLHPSDFQTSARVHARVHACSLNFYARLRLFGSRAAFCGTQRRSALFGNGFLLHLFGCLSVPFATCDLDHLGVELLLPLAAKLGHPWGELSCFSRHGPQCLRQTVLLDLVELGLLRGFADSPGDRDLHVLFVRRPGSESGILSLVITSVRKLDFIMEGGFCPTAQVEDVVCFPTCGGGGCGGGQYLWCSGDGGGGSGCSGGGGGGGGGGQHL